MPGSKTNGDNKDQEFKLEMERAERAMEKMAEAREQNIRQNHLRPQQQKQTFNAEEQEKLAEDSWENRKDKQKKDAILKSFEKENGVYFNVMPDETKKELYSFAWNQLSEKEQLEAISDFEAAREYFKASPLEKNAENFFGKDDLEKMRNGARWKDKEEPSSPKSKPKISEAERAKLPIAEQWKL